MNILYWKIRPSLYTSFGLDADNSGRAARCCLLVVSDPHASENHFLSAILLDKLVYTVSVRNWNHFYSYVREPINLGINNYIYYHITITANDCTACHHETLLRPWPIRAVPILTTSEEIDYVDQIVEIKVVVDCRHQSYLDHPRTQLFGSMERDQK